MKYVFVVLSLFVSARSCFAVGDVSLNAQLSAGHEDGELTRGKKKKWATALLQSIEKFLQKEAIHLIAQLPKILGKLEKHDRKLLDRDVLIVEIKGILVALERAQGTELYKQSFGFSATSDEQDKALVAVLDGDEEGLQLLFENVCFCYVALQKGEQVKEFKEHYMQLMQ
jgi:hypothetical protein